MKPLIDSARSLAALAPRLPQAAVGGVPGLVRALARRRPNGPAIRTLDGTLTWAEVDREAERRAAFWLQAGLNAGDCVALLLGNRAEVILQQLALGRLGAVSALVDHTLRGRGLQHTLDAAKARAAVVDAEGATALESVRFRGALGVWLGSDEPLPAGVRDLSKALGPPPTLPIPPVFVAPGDVYTYVFTSGTTGLPKAARIRHHRYLLAGAGLQAFAMWLEPTDVIFTPLPLHHSSAQIVGFSTALAAECCFAFSPRFSASHYWSEVRQLGATVGLYVGELCRYLVQTPAPEGSGGPADERSHGLRIMLGNGLRADVWPEFQARFGIPRIVEFYGASEGNMLLVNRDGKIGSCGRLLPVLRGPLDGLELVRYDVSGDTHLLDPKGHFIRCRPGEVGELLGRISALPTERFDGYLDARATNAKVLRSVFKKNDAWFRTGDLLRRDAEGDFYFVDRIGDTFRWKGENVSTQEVAEALNGRGGTTLVMVYGVTIPGCEGRAGMAAVQCGAGGFDPVDFWAAATERLPLSARPAFVRVSAQLETTGTMKFRRSTFQDEAFSEAVGASEPLFVRLDAEARYAPLTPELRGAVAAGSVRL